jgi:hypothetical protein
MKAVLCALVAALAVAGAAFAAGSSGGITPKVLADGKVAKPYTVKVTKSADVLVVAAKVAPGASFGWHTHRSAVAVAVTAGTLTLQRREDPAQPTRSRTAVTAPERIPLPRRPCATSRSRFPRRRSPAPASGWSPCPPSAGRGASRGGA